MMPELGTRGEPECPRLTVSQSRKWAATASTPQPVAEPRLNCLRPLFARTIRRCTRPRRTARRGGRIATRRGDSPASLDPPAARVARSCQQPARVGQPPTSDISAAACTKPAISGMSSSASSRLPPPRLPPSVSFLRLPFCTLFRHFFCPARLGRSPFPAFPQHYFSELTLARSLQAAGASRNTEFPFWVSSRIRRSRTVGCTRVALRHSDSLTVAAAAGVPPPIRQVPRTL